jgi:glycosyltransferase involved in cell wall biosynthesis
MQKALRKADKIIVTGRCMGQAIKHKDVKNEKIAFVPHWTNLHGMHLNKLPHTHDNGGGQDHSLVRKDESLKFRVVYAGNLGRAHPVGIVIRAAEILKSHPEIEFVFIGDDHSHSRLAQERDKRELNNIRFVPFQPAGHFQKILEAGDVHLVTLRPHMKGLLVPSKFYTALAVARPVIYVGPAESEIAMVIKDYRCGDVVEDLSAEKLVKAILKYRHDGQAWFEAQEGALKAGQDFYPNNALERWREILDNVHTKQPRRSQA